MKMFKCFSIMAILSLITVFAETTVVLQNGLNGYNGCQDLFIGNEKLSEFYMDANDGTAWQLVISKCFC